ncbi:MAG: sterol carrier protein domain-containing protein, partial [Nocardioides sp.]
SLPVAVLGSLYLGGQRLQSLARAGQVRVDDPGLAQRLDRALLADRAPFHGTPF